MTSKRLLALVVLPLLAVACGSPGAADPAAEETAAQDTAVDTAGDAASAQPVTPAPAGDPCAVLAAEPVRYDAAGKPMAFSFEYPGGWEIDELFVGAASSVDVRKDVDGDGSSDFVLRFGHSPTRPQENPGNLVEVWRGLPTTEEVTEIDVGGRTMVLLRSRIGEMTGYQALFPDPASDARAYTVSGGVTRALEGCEEEAVAAVERILTSLRPNPEMVLLEE